MKGNSDDRISKLPEPILHQILSFLRAKSAARMSTLSNVLDSAWNSLPYLKFGYIFDCSKACSWQSLLPSLNVLSLHGFNIELPADDGTINLSSLRELHLSFVFLGEQFIKAMCTSCCNLEHLSLQYFNGLTSFQVGDTLPKLKKIDLVNLEPPDSFLQLVDIAAINLE
ncbi:hypothetical protein BC332_16372 [Capsicum chinense]|nr:hypothetical protein BC332_16372 [Capsicum chinense]